MTYRFGVVENNIEVVQQMERIELDSPCLNIEIMHLELYKDKEGMVV